MVMVRRAFCIVPRSGEDPVSVGRMELNYDTGISEIVESLYQSETGEPFLVMCNGRTKVLVELWYLWEQKPDIRLTGCR